MRWKSDLGASRPTEGERPETSVAAVSAELSARGVAAALAERVAPRIAPQLEGKDAATIGATLDGAALSLRAEPSVREAGAGSELQEVERLMGAFATELGKLDEVLEVLAAYLRRMRTTSDATSRVLH